MPTVGATTGNLPHELTSFVGRRREIIEVRRLLSVSRLVTLTGVGGVGKTRLARRAAANSARAFDDGVWFVGLGELHDSNAIVPAVLGALNLTEGQSGTLETLLVEHLAARRVLLVLDNCEHLVASIATLAERLLRVCPALRILATSRESLNIEGEAVFRVPPLTMPESNRRLVASGGLAHYEAISLFADRAKMAVQGFAITENNQDSVAAICRRLEGLPLAIELAAVRLRVLSVDQILQRLTDRYALLTTGNRRAPVRQQTLQWCIDWSHELCTLAERKMWGRLAVFSGSFELDAVEGICADAIATEQTVDLVESLIDKSILIREEIKGAVRYRLLDTLRDYGLEQLQVTGEFASLLRRHRDWYEDVVLQAESDWISSRQESWIVRLDAEQPNIRAALQFCLLGPKEAEDGLRIAAALYPYWRVRGRQHEGMRSLTQLLTIHDAKPSMERIKALYVLSLLSGLNGEYEAAARYEERGGALAAQLDDRIGAALMSDAAGHNALIAEDYRTACECFESSLSDFRKDSNQLYLIWSLLGLTLASDAQGNRTRSEECQREALELTEARGETVYRGWAQSSAARLAWRRGEYSRAKNLLTKALRLARSVGDHSNASGCMEILSWVAVDEKAPRRAARLMGAGAALAQTVAGPSTTCPNLRRSNDQGEQKVRHAIGDRVFETEFRKGIRMRFEDAIRYALEEKDDAATTPERTPTNLTPREQQVAELVAKGLTNKSIADQLVISQRTAQGHVENILSKLGFTSRAQIAAWTIEQSQSRGSVNPAVEESATCATTRSC